MGIVQKPEGPGAGGISDQPGRQAISQIAPVQCTHETCLGALRENLQALGERFITVHVWDSWIKSEEQSSQNCKCIKADEEYVSNRSWQKCLSAFRPKNSSPSEQLVCFNLMGFSHSLAAGKPKAKLVPCPEQTRPSLDTCSFIPVLGSSHTYFKSFFKMLCPLNNFFRISFSSITKNLHINVRYFRKQTCKHHKYIYICIYIYDPKIIIFNFFW